LNNIINSNANHKPLGSKLNQPGSVSKKDIDAMSQDRANQITEKLIGQISDSNKEKS